MSGHGNFSAIDGVRPALPPMPPSGDDIEAVLNKSVGEVKAPGLQTIDGDD